MDTLSTRSKLILASDRSLVEHDGDSILLLVLFAQFGTNEVPNLNGSLLVLLC